MAADGFFRIALGVEYKGSRYRGWQRQASGVLTVQETLENALSKVADSPVWASPAVAGDRILIKDKTALTLFKVGNG